LKIHKQVYLGRDTPVYVFSRWRPSDMLNFTKNVILGTSHPMWPISICTKLNVNIFIGDQKYGQKSKSKMAAAAILDFNKKV